jgi:hypothetical protein
MILSTSSDPSPVVQAAVYMGGILAGYIMLLRPEEWHSAWETLRDTWFKHRNG